MAREKEVQFTVRGVPKAVAEMLRRKARYEGKSLNGVLVEALAASVRRDGEWENHDLDWLAGTWVEDPEFDQAIQAQHQVDEAMWR